jgi:hypothetical protein
MEMETEAMKIYLRKQIASVINTLAVDAVKCSADGLASDGIEGSFLSGRR